MNVINMPGAPPRRYVVLLSSGSLEVEREVWASSKEEAEELATLEWPSWDKYEVHEPDGEEPQG